MIILDGPMGSELGRYGVATPEPAWSATALDHAPDVVRAIHEAYARAGAEVHRANTFRAQPALFPERYRELVARATALARSAAGEGARSGGARSAVAAHAAVAVRVGGAGRSAHAGHVAGVIAPIADCYRPDLAPPPDVARRLHRAMAEALRDAGVDLLVCETFAHGGEAAIAVEEAARTGLETWAALTAGPDATLLSPERMEDAARACASAGAAAVLVNCTAASKTLPYIERLTRAGVPFGAYANAGDDWARATEDAVMRYLAHAERWSDAGATIIGACCGTAPAHVAALARRFTRRFTRR